ncbi:TatD family hydrolase [Pseudidiomarina taiwanensis]|uniref:Hydrolase TatD n=1 Tax=Pseudidiomarina taiwanensis TaxID=337250 RepID=A0A432ZFW9_9GAMM|nr:TatD family hydrolase [Pseudidiomarina taiwanensis]RUO76780.1 hydrolase TatD [Pseudidiomarina taiwanensis]
MPAWFDAGVNLTHPRLAHDVTGYIERAVSAGVERILVIGTSVAESQAAVALCEQFPEHLWATVGVHPHDAAAVSSDYLSILRDLAQHHQVRAIGECGLDYHRNFSPPAKQREVFAAQLELAAELSMPVYLHEREALADQLALLKSVGADIPRILVHCFTGSVTQLHAYRELDAYIGITGWVCDERRGQDLQQALPAIPANRLLLETDAPFLLPRTIRPRPRDNHSEFLPAIAATVAALRQQDIATLQQQCWDNTLEFFAR